jgi:hypothetical protein
LPKQLHVESKSFGSIQAKSARLKKPGTIAALISKNQIIRVRATQ